jgi:hypothetical protein
MLQHFIFFPQQMTKKNPPNKKKKRKPLSEMVGYEYSMDNLF